MSESIVNIKFKSNASEIEEVINRVGKTVQKSNKIFTKLIADFLETDEGQKSLAKAIRKLQINKQI